MSPFISDCQLPIADLKTSPQNSLDLAAAIRFTTPIGNWQSEIGNALM